MTVFANCSAHSFKAFSLPKLPIAAASTVVAIAQDFASDCLGRSSVTVAAAVGSSSNLKSWTD